MPKVGVHSVNSALYQILALFVSLVLMAGGCGFSGEINWPAGGNVGWVTITVPGAGSHSINAPGSRASVFLAGDAFVSPGGERTETLCPCSGWECIINPPPPESCETYTWYDDNVSVGIYNETTGASDSADITTSPSANHWQGSVTVELGENVIVVTASDHHGNDGEARVTVYLTDTVAPTVWGTQPADGANGVSIETTITASFSEEVVADTITPESFTVSTDGNPVDGALSVYWDGKSATFTPSASLDAHTTYVVTLGSGIRDLAGLTLAETSWSFSTVLVPPPSNVVAYSGDGRVALHWNAVPEVDSYNIYFRTFSGVTPANGTKIEGITETTYTHTGLVNGTRYYHIVTAVGPLGESAASSETMAIPGPLAVWSTHPEDGAVDVFPTTTVTANFSKVMNTDTITPSSFTVTVGGSPIDGTLDFGGDGMSAIFTPSTPLLHGVTYVATLSSLVQDMAGDTLAETSWSFSTALAPPPFNIVATPVYEGVNLQWNAVSGVDFYNIYFSTSAGVTPANGTKIEGITETTYAHAGLVNGTTYYYVVTSVDQASEGPASGEVLARAGLWITQSGTAARDMGMGIALGADGNSYVTGYMGTGDVGVTNIFVSRFGTAGNRLWITQFGTSGRSSGRDIAVDADGNSYVTGSVGFGTLAGFEGMGDIFITKLDASGTRLWGRQFGTIWEDVGTGIAVDADGNSYVTGATYDDLAGTGNAGQADVFVAKFDPSGEPLWVGQTGTMYGDHGMDIALGVDGSSYVTGYTNGDMEGTGKAGGRDIFTARFDPFGSLAWVRQLGTGGDDYGMGIALDVDGSPYITGRTEGDLEGAGDTGWSDIFIARLDAAGNLLWVHQFGTAHYDFSGGIALDADGTIHVTGTTTGDLAGTGNAGRYDFFIARFDAVGNPPWISQFGTTGYDYGQDIAVDADGNLYVTGSAEGDLAGTGHAGGGDVFTLKFYAPGSPP